MELPDILNTTPKLFFQKSNAITEEEVKRGV